MAALRRAPDIDQWRPEESSNRERERPRERPRERINDSRASSPAPRAARDSSRHRAPNTDNRQHARARSRERSLSRERTRRRSRSISREDRFRGNRREASADRVAHSRRHNHHHRDTTPSSKRHPSRSPSPKGSAKRVKRQRSRSIVRSRSRTRRADSTHRPARAYSPRPQRSDHERPPRRPTPDTYIPPALSRRRSPSPDTHYRPVAHRARKRSISLDRRSRRELSPRRLSPRRPDRRPVSPFDDPRERSYKPGSARDRERSRSRAPRRPRSRTPPRRRSPAPLRRGSPPNPKRARLSPRRSRSPRAPVRRRPSRSPSPASKPPPRTDKGAEPNKSVHANKTTSRRASPAPASGYASDTSKAREDDDKMRGAYQYQGRGGFQQSPPYAPHNQYSPQNQSPYHGGRGGWNGQPYPNQGSVSIPCHVSLLLTSTGLLCKASHRTSLPTLRTSRLGSTKISHIHSLASTALIEEVTAASVAPTSTVPIGGYQGLVPARLLCKGAEVVVLRLPSFRTYRGHQLLAHEAAAPLPKPHVRSLPPYPSLRLTLCQSMPMTTHFARQKTCVWRMRGQKKRRSLQQNLLEPSRQRPSRALDSRSRRRTQCHQQAKLNLILKSRRSLSLLLRSLCWLRRRKRWRLVSHRVTRTQGVIETGIPGIEITTAIETPESAIVDMMIPMTASPPTETRATGMSETYEIHATPTAIERGTTEIRGTVEIETTETCEIHGTPETSEIAENLSCLGDLMTGDQTHDLILALALDQNEGHHLRKCPRRRSS
jgi:hypothetical protein